MWRQMYHIIPSKTDQHANIKTNVPSNKRTRGPVTLTWLLVWSTISNFDKILPCCKIGEGQCHHFKNADKSAVPDGLCLVLENNGHIHVYSSGIGLDNPTWLARRFLRRCLKIVDNGQCRRMLEHWYTVSWLCEPDSSGELKI